MILSKCLCADARAIIALVDLAVPACARAGDWQCDQGPGSQAQGVQAESGAFIFSRCAVFAFVHAERSAGAACFSTSLPLYLSTSLACGEEGAIAMYECIQSGGVALGFRQGPSIVNAIADAHTYAHQDTRTRVDAQTA